MLVMVVGHLPTDRVTAPGFADMFEKFVKGLIKEESFTNRLKI